VKIPRIGRSFFILFISAFCNLLQAQVLTPEATPSPGPALSTETLYLLSGRILEQGTKNTIVGGSLYLEAVGNTLVAEPVTNSLETPTAPTTPSPTPLPATFSVDADLKGNYQVSVPAGTYRLTVAAVGFKKVTLDSFAVGKDVAKDFYLKLDGFTLPEVLVSTSKVPKTQVSHETLSKEELTEVPGTQEDILKALQALPGVITAGSLNGQLLVRGSGPFDNQYYVDNVPIAFPYHFGIVSTLDSNLVKDIDFYSGGFGPQYPNSMGGLVDLTQRDPRSDRWGFRADVNLFLSEFEVEGPVTSNSSLAIAYRRSYLDLFLHDFSGSQGDIEVPVFSDYQMKYSYDPSPKVHWDFVAFGSDDSVSGTISASATVAVNDPDLAGSFDFSDGYHSQGINYRDTSDDRNTLVNTLYHTNSYFNFSLGPGLYEDATIEDFGDKVSLTHDFDPDTSLEGGLQYDHFINALNAYFVIDPAGGQAQNNNLTLDGKIRSQDSTNSDDFSAYLDQRFKTLDRKLEFSLGARLDYVNSDSTLFLTPKASAAYHLTGDTTLKASYGYYDEAPDRISAGPYLDQNLGNPHLAPEQSIATVFGVEQKLNESGLLLRVEGYEKDLSSLIVSNPNSTPGVGYLNSGTGTARGLEFFLRQPPTERFFGWIAYSLSDSQRQDAPGASTYPFEYDEPNVFTAVGSYKLNPNWDMGFKVLYATGHPYTPVLSAPPTVVSGPTTIYVPLYAPTDSARLPDYKRVDFSTSFKKVYDTWEWKIYVDVVNLFHTQNVLGYQYNSNYTQTTKELDLPFLPYIGFEVTY
jgi:hypothetical protein